MDKETAGKYVSEECVPFLDNIVEMLNAPYFKDNGMEPVKIEKECVVIGKKIEPRDRNSNGFWHGATIFGVIDHAFAILSNIEGHAVGQSSSINYYRPGKGDYMTARAKFINVSRSLYYVYVEAFDGEKMVASCMCTAFRLNEIRH